MENHFLFQNKYLAYFGTINLKVDLLLETKENTSTIDKTLSKFDRSILDGF